MRTGGGGGGAAGLIAALAALVPPQEPLPTFSYTLLDTFPHDTASFTQGLHFEQKTGTLLESTGLYGDSCVRRVDIPSGRPLCEGRLADHWFGEGLAVLGDTCFQLLWREGLCLLHSADELTLKRTVPLPRGMREGWGLTTAGEGTLYASDGTSTLHVLDENLEVTRTVSVRAGGRPLHYINDLQFVRGEIWANIWSEDRLAIIDAHTGEVRGFVDLSPLLTVAERRTLRQVLRHRDRLSALRGELLLPRHRTAGAAPSRKNAAPGVGTRFTD